MSSKKQGGKLKQQKRTNPKFLGVKVSASQKVSTGNILIRQRGTHYKSGAGTLVGRDHTILASKPGTVKFSVKLGRKTVSVV